MCVKKIKTMEAPNIETFTNLVTTRCKCNSNKEQRTTQWPLGGDITTYKSIYQPSGHQVVTSPHIKKLLTSWTRGEDVILTKRNKPPSGHHMKISQNILKCINLMATKLIYKSNTQKQVQISANIKECIYYVAIMLRYNSNIEKLITQWPQGGDITKYKRMY